MEELKGRRKLVLRAAVQLLFLFCFPGAPDPQEAQFSAGDSDAKALRGKAVSESHPLTFLFLSGDLSGSHCQGRLSSCVSLPLLRWTLEDHQACPQFTPLLTCRGQDIWPRQPLQQGLRNSGGGGRPSLIQGSRRENRTQAWAEVTLLLWAQQLIEPGLTMLFSPVFFRSQHYSFKRGSLATAPRTQHTP